MTALLRSQWRQAARPEPPYPKALRGMRVDWSLQNHRWWHSTTTGRLVGLVHAGTLKAARDRATSLFNVDWSPSRFHTPPPSHWQPTQLAMVFAVEPSCPIVNDESTLITDDQANDESYVRQRTGGRGMLLYENTFEDRYYPSVVAPAECYTIIGFDAGNGFWRLDSKVPSSASLDIATRYREFIEAQRAWERWADEQDEDEEEAYW